MHYARVADERLSDLTHGWNGTYVVIATALTLLFVIVTGSLYWQDLNNYNVKVKTYDYFPCKVFSHIEIEEPYNRLIQYANTTESCYMVKSAPGTVSIGEAPEINNRLYTGLIITGCVLFLLLAWISHITISR